MDRKAALGCLRTQWRAYIQRHCHSTARRADLGALLSRDRKGRPHRWLLLVGNRPGRILSDSERDFIRTHLRTAAPRERVYLVVGFLDEPGRIVALPARAALEAGRIDADRAGVPWDS